MSKQRHKKPYSSEKRRIHFRPTKKRVLIVCEGEKTEPNYFEGFRKARVIDLTIDGTGYNTQSLVNYAIEKTKGDIYDIIWCVFDKDSFTPNDFNNAIFTARKNKIKVAYSNEAFELWYILHYNPLQSSLTRDKYIIKLTQILGSKYEKNSKNMFDILLPMQKIAIQNAEKLSENITKSPANDNPSTTVHLLGSVYIPTDILSS